MSNPVSSTLSRFNPFRFYFYEVLFQIRIYLFPSISMISSISKPNEMSSSLFLISLPLSSLILYPIYLLKGSTTRNEGLLFSLTSKYVLYLLDLASLPVNDILELDLSWNISCIPSSSDLFGDDRWRKNPMESLLGIITPLGVSIPIARATSLCSQINPSTIG